MSREVVGCGGRTALRQEHLPLINGTFYIGLATSNSSGFTSASGQSVYEFFFDNSLVVPTGKEGGPKNMSTRLMRRVT